MSKNSLKELFDMLEDFSEMDNTGSIFTKIHTTRERDTMPIVSMDSQHLVNYLNFMLIKETAQIEDELKRLILGQVAPENMDDRTRRSLGLKRITPAQMAEFEAKFDEARTLYVNSMFVKLWPYIIVGVCRNDTREGVIRILHEVTGVTERIELDHLYGRVTNPVLRSINSEEREEWLDMGDLGF